MTGPFTFAAGIKGEDDIALVHDKVFLQAIRKGLAMKALWQIEQLRQFRKPVVVFIDEPFLGCFGSAYTPLNRDDALQGLREFTEALKAADVLTGLHCCGNTDWSILTDVETLDIINFDAFGYFEKLALYAADLKKFIARGGIPARGWCDNESLSGITAQSLAGKIDAGIEALAKKGVDKDLLFAQMLISPACGLGTLEAPVAEKTLQLLSQTSKLLQGRAHA